MRCRYAVLLLLCGREPFAPFARAAVVFTFDLTLRALLRWWAHPGLASENASVQACLGQKDIPRSSIDIGLKDTRIHFPMSEKLLLQLTLQGKKLAQKRSKGAGSLLVEC